MKLRCINTDGTIPGLLEIGKVYDISEPYKDWYMVNDCSVKLSNFETPIDILEAMIRTGNKVILSKPGKGYTVEILLTDTYLIVYSHSKGNHWNISGNHYKYYHSREKQKFVPDKEVYIPGKVLLKQRMLLPDFKRLAHIRGTELGKNQEHNYNLLSGIKPEGFSKDNETPERI